MPMVVFTGFLLKTLPCHSGWATLSYLHCWNQAPSLPPTPKPQKALVLLWRTSWRSLASHISDRTVAQTFTFLLFSPNLFEVLFIFSIKLDFNGPLSLPGLGISEEVGWKRQDSKPGSHPIIISYLVCDLWQKLEPFSVKGQNGNILDFSRYKTSVLATQFCYCIMKATIQNT